MQLPFVVATLGVELLLVQDAPTDVADALHHTLHDLLRTVLDGGVLGLQLLDQILAVAVQRNTITAPKTTYLASDSTYYTPKRDAR